MPSGSPEHLVETRAMENSVPRTVDSFELKVSY